MLSNNGLDKLAEECAELIVVKEKIGGFGSLGFHWDNQEKSLKDRLEDEIADVRAACSFVAKHFELDYNRMADRYDMKRDLFEYWHNGGTEIAIPAADARD